MRHALDVQRARLLVPVNAGRVQSGDAARIAQEENDVLGPVLREQ